MPSVIRMTMLIASIATLAIVVFIPPTRYKHTRDKLTNRHEIDEICKHRELTVTSAVLPATTDTNALGTSSANVKNISDNLLVHSTTNVKICLMVPAPFVF